MKEILKRIKKYSFNIFLTFLIFLFVIGSIYYLFFNNNEKKVSYCVSKIPYNNETLYTRYCPEDVKDIPISLSFKNGLEVIKKYKGGYILINPNLSGNYTVAFVNLRLKLYMFNVGCYNYTTKNCTYIPLNETSKYKDYFFVALILSKNNTYIYQKNNTVYIKGTNKTIEKAIDRFIFYWYNVSI